jgi:26S proteasome regulatory subunit N7
MVRLPSAERLRLSVASQLIVSEMAPYVSYLPLEFSSEQSTLVSSLREKNDKYLVEIDTKLKDAEENMGESDVSELWRQRAMYLCRIGDKVG